MRFRRKKGGYFQPGEGAPDPLVVRVKRRVQFSEVDVMGMAWYGRYPALFEEASAELGRRCGLSYRDFAEANLRAPVVQLHIDYHQPLGLDEEITIMVAGIWTEGARLNTEFTAIKQDGSIAAAGYTVQMLIDSVSGEACLTSPELLERCRKRWKAGELACLK